MNSTAVFFFLAGIFFFSTGDAAINAGTAAITRLKSTTTTTKNDLERYGRNLVYNLNFKLGDQKITELTNINAIVNPALSDVKSAIATAKANGKNADHCYEPARIALRQASFIDANKELDECKNTGVATINPVKNNVDATVLLGMSIINELDSIAINCYAPNAIAYQNCIIAQIPNASLTVQTYENTASQLKSTGDSVSSSALTDAFRCNQRPTQKVRQAATEVRSSANKCIADA